MLTIFI